MRRLSHSLLTFINLCFILKLKNLDHLIWLTFIIMMIWFVSGWFPKREEEMEGEKEEYKTQRLWEMIFLNHWCTTQSINAETCYMNSHTFKMRPVCPVNLSSSSLLTSGNIKTVAWADWSCVVTNRNITDIANLGLGWDLCCWNKVTRQIESSWSCSDLCCNDLWTWEMNQKSTSHLSQCSCCFLRCILGLSQKHECCWFHPERHFLLYHLERNRNQRRWCYQTLHMIPQKVSVQALRVCRC